MTALMTAILIGILFVLSLALSLFSIWKAWGALPRAGSLQKFLAILWAAAAVYLFCPALYSKLAIASHTSEYNPHIGEIRLFINIWLVFLMPTALLTPTVLTWQNRWHGAWVFGKLAALYAGISMLCTILTGGYRCLTASLLPSLWGWWETLFVQHGWGGTLYDLHNCRYGTMSSLIWWMWVIAGSGALLVARLLCTIRTEFPD